LRLRENLRSRQNNEENNHHPVEGREASTNNTRPNRVQLPTIVVTPSTPPENNNRGNTRNSNNNLVETPGVEVTPVVNDEEDSASFNMDFDVSQLQFGKLSYFANDLIALYTISVNNR